jgi:hypothetical protein
MSTSLGLGSATSISSTSIGRPTSQNTAACMVHPLKRPAITGAIINASAGP